MSVNKILKKRRQQSQTQIQSNSNQYQQTPSTSFIQQPRTSHPHSHSNHSQSIQSKQLQQQYQRFSQFTQYNPQSYNYSHEYLPNNATFQNRIKIPISIFLPPVSYQSQPIQRSIDKIPRCGSCRAYMTYYNEVKKKSYKCFLCGRQNGFVMDYLVDTENVELNQPSYHVLGGQNIYAQSAPENAFIFLIDLNSSSYQSKMLYYFITVLKQVLSREQLNQTQIYFFTYDEVVHEYDFSGEQVKCTVLDPTIKQSQKKCEENFLVNIRDKLFNLLDTLEEFAEHNKKQGSNFQQAFKYVHQVIKHTGGKMFIFQSNQAISGETFTNQYIKPENTNNQTQTRPKSFLQTKNKKFFHDNITNLLNQTISCAFFIFQKNYKNIRVLSDLCKLTNSQLNLYKKDISEDLTRFYYDLYNLLSAPYYSDVRMQLVLSSGFYFTAVYGNLYRIKQYIVFKFCHLQPSKRVCVCILPQQTISLPYCSMQVITNYRYNRQHYVAVNTIVMPLTNNVEKLYTGLNYQIVAASLQKTYLSCLRLEEINTLKNKAVKQIAGIWKAANQFYKKKPPAQIHSFILSFLGLLKSQHFQLQSINDTIMLDNIVSQRNYLQSCIYLDIQNFFSPYLFNLSTLTPQMCISSQQQQFIYPQVCQLKFSSVKQGIYLLDNGISLILYISKQFNPILLKQLFNKQKLTKNDILTEDMIQDQQNNGYEYAQQVMNLIRVLRQQKGYGWIPLYIVRCGEGTINEKQFYMNFYAEKYDEFRNFKMTLNQFEVFLNQQV